MGGAVTSAAAADFTGRDWVVKAVEEWLRGTEPTFLLTGPPGSGKSTFVGHLPGQALPGEIVYLHSCNALDSATLDPLVFIQELAKALARQLPGFKQALLSASAEHDSQLTRIRGKATAHQAARGAVVAGVWIEQLILGDRSPQRAYFWCIRRPLQKLANRPSEPLVVVVDALDEAGRYSDGDNLVDLLVTIRSELDKVPANLRLLLTSRRDDRVLRRLPGPVLDLVDDTPADVDDVREYAWRRLATLPEPARSKLARKVAEAGEQNFLYTRYLLDDLVHRPGLSSDDVDLIALPHGLDGHYRDFLERELRRSQERWEERFRPLLGLLAIARGKGLTRDLLIGASKLSASEVDDALLRLQQYLSGTQPMGPFRFYHLSFRDFLLGEKVHPLYPAEAETDLTDHLISLAATLDGGLRLWTAASDYARSHLAEHAGAAGRLDELLEDPGFLLAAEPIRLLRILGQATSQHGLEAADVFALTFHHLVRKAQDERASYLQLLARQVGADWLADRIGVDGTGLKWSTPWARCQPHTHRILGGHEGGISALALGELDGQSVAVSGGEDGTIRIWDFVTGAQRGKFLHSHGGGGVTTLVLGELEGHPVAVSGGKTGVLRVWDLISRVQRGKLLRGHKGPVSTLAVGELDGQPIAVSGGENGTLQVWDLATGSQSRKPLRDHGPQFEDAGVIAAAVGELDGGPIVVYGVAPMGLMWSTLRVWDLSTGAQPAELWRGDDAISALAIGRRDGRLIAISGSHSGTLRLWDLKTGTQDWEYVDGSHLSAMAITALALGHLGGHPVAVSGHYDGTIRVWDLTAGVPLGEPMRGYEAGLMALAFGEVDDRSVIVSGGDDGILRVWELGTGTDRGRPRRPQHSSGIGRVTSLAAGNVNGHPVAVSGHDDGTVRAWEVVSGALQGDPMCGPKPDRFWSAAVRVLRIGELCGRPIAVSGGHELLRIWDLATSTQLREIRHEHSHEIYTLALGELGGRPVAVSGGVDGWQQTIAILPGQTDSRSNDWTLQVWDLESGDLIEEPVYGDEDWTTALAVGLFLDPPIAVSGAEDGTIRIWDLATGAEWDMPLRGHRGAVLALIHR